MEGDPWDTGRRLARAFCPVGHIDGGGALLPAQAVSGLASSAPEWNEGKVDVASSAT